MASFRNVLNSIVLLLIASMLYHIFKIGKNLYNLVYAYLLTNLLIIAKFMIDNYSSYFSSLHSGQVGS